MSLCAAEELERLCGLGSAYRECEFAQEDPLPGPHALLASGPKDIVKLKPEQLPPPSLAASQQSDDEEGDLLWCPSPTLPRVMVPPSEAAGPALSHYPELSSSSNSDSSMCTAFELGHAHSKGASQLSAPPSVTHLTINVEEPLVASVPKDAVYPTFGPQVQKQQQQQHDAMLTTPIAGAALTPIQKPLPPPSWPLEVTALPAPSAPDAGSLPAPLATLDVGSPKCEASTAVAISCVAAAPSMEPTPLEGGGRISPDLSSCENPAEQQQQLLQPARAPPAPQVAAAPGGAGSAVQSTRQTKRTPIPSVRLQRMLEGEAPAPPKRQQQSKKKQQGGSSSGSAGGGAPAASGGKRSAEEPQEQSLFLQQHKGGSDASSLGGADAQRRIKPRLQLGSSSGAACIGGGSSMSVAAAASAGFALNQGMFAWPDEQEVMSSSQRPGVLDVASGNTDTGLLCGEPLFVGPEGPPGLMPMGLTSAGEPLPAPPLNTPTAAMWAPSCFSTQGEDAGIDLQLPTDLLEVAAELAAAADKDGEGHGIRGSSVIWPANQRQHLQSMMISSSTHARLQSLGNCPRPVPHCKTASVVAPQPPKQAALHTPEDYDGHIDSENGLPQVPPPRLPAGQPRGAPRPPARVLVPHPTGGCCTACKVSATPVWRTGPHGPKTLCNACGVRYTKVVRRK